MTVAAPRLLRASASKHMVHTCSSPPEAGVTAPAGNGASVPGRAGARLSSPEEMAVMSGAVAARAADVRSTVGVHGVLGTGAGGVAAPGPGKRSSRRRGEALRRLRCDMLWRSRMAHFWFSQCKRRKGSESQQSRNTANLRPEPGMRHGVQKPEASRGQHTGHAKQSAGSQGPAHKQRGTRRLSTRVRANRKGSRCRHLSARRPRASTLQHEKKRKG